MEFDYTNSQYSKNNNDIPLNNRIEMYTQKYVRCIHCSFLSKSISIKDYKITDIVWHKRNNENMPDSIELKYSFTCPKCTFKAKISNFLN